MKRVSKWTHVLLHVTFRGAVLNEMARTCVGTGRCFLPLYLYLQLRPCKHTHVRVFMYVGVCVCLCM